MVVEDETKNVIILKLNSDSDISFSVKNLVVVGEIETTAALTLKTKEDLFNFGKIKSERLVIESEKIYNGVSDIALEKIQALGIAISKSPSGGVSINMS